MKKARRMRQVSPRRARENARYRRLEAKYLADHPLCQIFLARHRIDEATVLSVYYDLYARYPGSVIATAWNGLNIPQSTQVHHRNKRDRTRLNRMEYWMAGSAGEHQWTEDHKDEARAIGILCPINARPDGSMPDGRRCLTTPELMAARAAGQIDPILPA
jgi:hypothetical protein